jgi:dTDP-4-amino-4,6-dideoxygalactose transaminase
MSEVAAALGVVQLKRLDEFIASREKIAKVYTEGLKKIPSLTTVLPQGRSSWYKYIVLLPKGVDRDKFKAAAKEKGVSLSGGVYELPLHRQPVFEGKISGSFPAADDVCARHICFPLYHGMTEDEGRFVVETVQSLL